MVDKLVIKINDVIPRQLNLTSLSREGVAEIVILLSVILAGAALRFTNLGKWSFWGDEYITVTRVQNLGQLPITQRSLSLFLTGWFVDQFGVSEWNARFIPALIGLLTIPILFLIARRMFNSKVALLSCAFLAISPWHLYWSQNARFYTALLLFSMLGLMLFYFGLEENRPGYLIGSMFFFVLSIMERQIGFLNIMVAGAYLVLVWILPMFEKPPGLNRRNLLILIIPGIVGGSIFLYQLPYLQNPELWVESFGFVNNNPIFILGGVIFFIGIPLIVTAAGGAIYLLRNVDRKGLLLSIAIGLPIILITTLSLLQYAANRYIFIVLPAVTMLAAVAVWELLQLDLKNARPVAFALILILFLAPMGENAMYYIYQNGNRDDWKSATEYIKTHYQEGDLVYSTHRELVDYYLTTDTYCMRCVEIYPDAHAEARQLADAKPIRAWYLVDLTAPDKAPETINWLKRNAQLVAEFDVNLPARTFPMKVYLTDPAAFVPADK